MYIIYGLFLSTVPFNSLLELGNDGGFVYGIQLSYIFSFPFLNGEDRSIRAKWKFTNH